MKKNLSRRDMMERVFEVNTDWLYDYEEQERKRQERMQPEESSAGQDYKDESGKIVPMKKRETTGITLMKLDANHRVMGAVPRE